jgi:F0F1-type ATP synthase membrane subunit b/b'
MKIPAGFLSRRLILLGAALALALTALLPAVALAAPKAPAACDLACLKTFGDNQIALRFTALDALSAKITALGPSAQATTTPTTAATATTATPKGLLTADQVSALQTQVQNEKNSLTTLKQKIDADTDVTTARADDRSIMMQYRVFAVFMPLLRHMVWVDLMTNALGKLSGLDDKIQTAISKAPASQQAQLTALFNDYKAKLTDAQTQLTNAANLFASMTPDAYNKNPSTFKVTTLASLHKDTTAALKDIKAARADLHQIAMLLKADQASGTTTPTTSAATATATP